MHRRSLLIAFGAIAAAPAVTAQSPEPISPAGDAAKPLAKPKSEMEFRMGIIGPAELSLVTSQIAVERANPN